MQSSSRINCELNTYLLLFGYIVCSPTVHCLYQFVWQEPQHNFCHLPKLWTKTNDKNKDPSEWLMFCLTITLTEMYTFSLLVHIHLGIWTVYLPTNSKISQPSQCLWGCWCQKTCDPTSHSDLALEGKVSPSIILDQRNLFPENKNYS